MVTSRVSISIIHSDVEVMMVYSHASSSGDVNGEQMDNYPLHMDYLYTNGDVTVNRCEYRDPWLLFYFLVMLDQGDQWFQSTPNFRKTYIYMVLTCSNAVVRAGQRDIITQVLCRLLSTFHLWRMCSFHVNHVTCGFLSAKRQGKI